MTDMIPLLLRLVEKSDGKWLYEHGEFIRRENGTRRVMLVIDSHLPEDLNYSTEEADAVLAVHGLVMTVGMEVNDDLLQGWYGDFYEKSDALVFCRGSMPETSDQPIAPDKRTATHETFCAALKYIINQDKS